MWGRQCGGPCTPDCAGKVCGDDGCGGSCGACKDGEACTQLGACQCVPDCKGKACGADGCGGTCGGCGTGAACNNLSQCQCVPKCDGKTCGPDGCGGTCGVCAKGTICDGGAGKCNACTADCKGKVCGDDGCGGTCGSCPAGKGCGKTGQCDCAPDCTGKVCGDDGCGWFCGFCSAPDICNPNTKTCCLPDCKGKKCGDDGCGGSCGGCGPGTICGAAGKCVKGCAPDCEGKLCGDDGCGGQCGACQTGELCNIAVNSCVSAFCPGTPAVGCCDGEAAEMCVALSAQQPAIKGYRYRNCLSTGQHCGWDASTKSYGCVSTPNPVDPSGKYPRGCFGAPPCVPDCKGKACGSDGCGKSCGSCGSGQKCNLETSKCYDDICEDLQGAACCGGPGGNTLYSCDDNNGVITYGEKNCAAAGNKKSCGWDGAKYACGTDGGQAPATANLPRSCPPSICLPNCSGKTCGDDGCGGSCGACGTGLVCTDNQCKKPCFPEETCRVSFTANDGEKITNIYCNQSDGCGGACECPSGLECKKFGFYGLCKPPKKNNCGDITDPCCDGQVLKWCSDPGGDAAKVVKTANCLAEGKFCGWAPGSFSYNCGEGTGSDPSGKKPKYCKGAAQTCAPVCDGKGCGPDGCGGTCGVCKGGELCHESTGKCITNEGCHGAPLQGCCEGNVLKRCLKPTPTSKADLSIESCNVCGWSAAESAYSCQPTSGAAPDPAGTPRNCPCVGICGSNECGDDGCGGSCGTCKAGTKCSKATFVCKDCKVQCAGKVCGDDTCNGSCGTCAAGTQCDDQGQCVKIPPPPTCQNTPWQGSCNKEVLQFCAGGKITLKDCAEDKHCGWNELLQAYSCGTKGGVDPTGTYPKAAVGTKALCIPQCAGKSCGDDGCGGDCGKCVSGAICGWGGLCVEDPNLKSWYPPKEGCCFPKKKPSDPAVMTKYMGSQGRQPVVCSAKKGGLDCGRSKKTWDIACGTLGANGTLLDPLPVQICKECGTCAFKGPCAVNDCGQSCGGCWAADGLTCNYSTGNCDPIMHGASCANLCDKQNPMWPCQCDAKCAERGDCCGNYALACLAKTPKPNACGNGTCQSDLGESCSTCAADCGACTVPVGFDPPWASPFAQATAAAGTPYQVARNLIGGLDQILPAAPPYPVNGLVAHLPRRDVNAGPPMTTVVQGSLQGGGQAAEIDGVTGKGWSFASGGQPNFGTVRVLLDDELPRYPFATDASPGGYSLAFWFKAPKGGADAPNPLLYYEGGQIGDVKVCAWSRAGDTKLRVKCPKFYGPNVTPDPTISSIRAYFGSTNGSPSPDGNCAKLATVGPNYRCHLAQAAALAEKQCLGKQECELDPLSQHSDPCAGVADATAKLVVHATCSYGSPNAAGMLAIEPENYGGRLQLRFSDVAMRTAGPITKDVWHHVALTFHPYPGASTYGERVLYLDGQPQGVEHTAYQPIFNKIVLGAGTLGPPPGAGGNDQAQTIPSTAQMDDVFVYDRALTAGEVRGLIAKRDNKLLRVWPTVQPEQIAKVGIGMTAGTATDALITAPNLIDPTTQKPIAARHHALGLGKGATYAPGIADGDLETLDSFTLVGWVRPQALTADKPLLTLLLEGDAHATVAVSASCSNRAVTAFTGPTKIPADPGCEHGLAAGQWAFVALVQSGKTQTVYVDGYKAGTHSLPTATKLFDIASFNMVRTLQAGDGVDLAWAALFGRALAVGELNRYGSSGPAIWLDGAKYKDGGASRLRDYADFRNHNGTQAADRPTLRTSGGAVAQVAQGAAPLELANTKAAMVTVPLRGRLRPANAAGVWPFTFSARVKLDKDAPDNLPLLALDDGSKDANAPQNKFNATLACTRSSPARITCRVDAGGWRLDGKWANWSTSTRSAVLSSADEAFELAVSVAFDGDKLRVAFGTEDIKQVAAGKPAMSAQMVPVTVKTIGTTAVNGAKLTTAIAGPYLRIGGATTSSGDVIQLSNVRLYSRVVTDLEMVRLLTQGCAALGCDVSGQICAPSPAGALPTCSACDGKHLEAASVLGGVCAPRLPFFEPCVLGAQCESDLCRNGRCTTKDAAKACKDTCADLGRECVLKSKAFPDLVHATCSEECLPYYAKPSDDPTAGRCQWQPTATTDEICTTDDQCKVTGACVTSTEPTYSVKVNWSPPCVSGGCPGWISKSAPLACNSKYDMSYVGQPGVGASASTGGVCPAVVSASSTPDNKGRCAGKDAPDCKARHRLPRLLRGRAKDGADVVQCGDCTPEKAGDGTPLWVKRWRLISPELCKKMLDKGTLNRITGKSNQGIRFLYDVPSIQLLAMFVLGHAPNTLVTPKDVAKMIRLGVGPELIDMMLVDTVKAEWFQSYPNLWLMECARQTITNKGDEVTSPFFDPQVNYQICAPNQFPDGTNCPPAGTPAALADQFCQSGFCGRDSGICEEGYGRLEETDAADKSDEEKEGGDGGVGAIGLVQRNNTVAEFKRSADGKPQSAAHKREYSIALKNVHDLHLFGATVEVFGLANTMTGKMDEEEASFAPQVLLGGIAVPQSPDPPTNCPGAKWENGEYKKSDKPCTADKPSPDAMGVLVPSSSLCFPSPGGCEDDPNHKPPVGSKLKSAKGTGPLCHRTVVFVGPVPITIEAGAVLTPCLSMGTAIDEETYEPAFQFKPEIGVGLEIKGGLSAELGVVEMFAGVKAAVTIVKLGFPVTWAISVAAAKGFTNLFTVGYARKVSFEVTILELALSAFAEASVGGGIFSVSWEYGIYSFPGFQLSWELGAAESFTKKIDFQHKTANQ